MNNTTAAVTVTVVEDGVEFAWSDEALERWDDTRTGLRFEVGSAYVETDEAGRSTLIEQFGAGFVRRALLVAAKSCDEETGDRVAALRDAITTRLVKAA